MPAVQATYAFPNAREVQRERLRALEVVLDPGTIRHLEARGVAAGWRCLEVGAGGGSIAAWLCERVAPDGRVLATDLDVTLLRERAHPNLDIRVHDVLRDEVPAGEFDLIHARLLQAWLDEPRGALERLVTALKPGGWLVAEELDFVSVAPDPRVDESSRTVFERVVRAHVAVLGDHHGFDAYYGRGLAGALVDAGLEDVGSEGRASMWRGGEDGARVWQLTFIQLREAMPAAGLPAADCDLAIRLRDDPRLSFVSPLVMAAWGRAPHSGSGD